MISEKIDLEIAAAMKSHENDKLAVLREIKTEFTKFKTAKVGNVLDDVAEATILIKLMARHEDSISQYKAASREDLVEEETKQLDVLKLYAPKQVTDEDVANETRKAVIAFRLTQSPDYVLSMKDMKQIIGIVKGVYPTANGKVISTTFNEILKA